ncbi:MAG: hypothetical protein ABSG25_16415 [Bryobacteraceae bacterium]
MRFDPEYDRRTPLRTSVALWLAGALPAAFGTIPAMAGGPNKQSYSRKEAARVLGVTERQLTRWEAQELLPRLDEYVFSDLIAVRSLQKLRNDHVPSIRIRQAVKALREKLRDVSHPLRDLQIVRIGKKVAVLLDGQKMEAVSGQLLLDFDRAELKSLLSFPRESGKSKPGSRKGSNSNRPARRFRRSKRLTSAPSNSIPNPRARS